MQRMLIERMENRILVGTVTFIGIMIMFGWVAINENARMASFTQQFEARSIERGAELFAANCTTCHGTDGRGINGRAPALNSPHFFGYDFAPVARKTRNDLRDQVAGLNNELTRLNTELTTLQTEAAGVDVTAARQAEIQTRIDEINLRIPEINVALAPDTELQVALAAAEAEFDTYVVSLDAAVLNGYDPELPSRLVQANWGGTVDDYIFTTLVHGRAQNAAMWNGNLMVSWSQRGTGSMRDDQVWDLVRYIVNFDKGVNWTLDDLYAVNQFAKVPGAVEEGRPEITADAAGDNPDVVLAAWEANGIVGDAARGELLYNNREWSQRAERLGCLGCHQGAAQGPATEGTWDRVINERLTEPQFAGYSPEKYILQSILIPGAYIVPGYADGVMPLNFSERTSVQDLADIVAYIKTQTSVTAGVESGS
ncbi:MAG: c-type cytochrome [Armatimonadetes bacterium]|nr:c-type cytochrome [Anaerolineae bacterium]